MRIDITRVGAVARPGFWCMRTHRGFIARLWRLQVHVQVRPPAAKLRRQDQPWE